MKNDLNQQQEDKMGEGDGGGSSNGRMANPTSAEYSRIKSIILGKLKNFGSETHMYFGTERCI